MTARGRRIAILSGLLTFAMCLTAPAVAQVTPYSNTHDHNLPTGFRLHTTTLNSAQRSQVVAMMKEWEAETQMDYSVQTSSSHTNPSGTGWRTEGNLIWEGDVPSLWISAGCPSSTSGGGLACTLTQPNSGGHLDQGGNGVDTVFYSRIEWINYSSTSTCLSEQDNHMSDPSYDDYDQKSVALHEMGHWIRLLHNGDGTSVMYGDYINDNGVGHYCQWNVFSGDANRVTTHYNLVGH